MTTVVRALAAAVAALALAGCVGGSDDAAPTPDRGLTDAQRRLAELARAAATASYDVTYSLRAASGDTGTIRIVAAPPSYRVDVAPENGPASVFIQHAGTVVSCSTKGGQPSCFLVARQGEPVPSLFDPGVQRLFSDAVADLAAHPERYVVTPRSATPSAASRGECFDVRRTGPASPASAPSPTADPTGFETGQYCFAPDGVLTQVEVSTGTLTLLTRAASPTAALFVPPATPVALPPLPSPS